MNFNRLSGWVFIGGIGVGVLLLVFVLLFAWAFKPGEITSNTSEVQFTVVPAPSATTTPTLVVNATPTPEGGTPLVQNGFKVGVYVQIFGTEGGGLRLRSTAGTSGSILSLAMDSEVFQIVDGPQSADGYVWWYLESPYDKNRAGWAASDYLTVIQP